MRSMILIALGFLTSVSTWAVLPKREFLVDFQKGQGNVEFLAVGRPGALKIRGKIKDDQKQSNPLTGTLSFKDLSATGSVKFQLGALDTGIEMRDKHMKNTYLEVQKFPEAEFQMTKLNLPADFSKEDFSSEALPFEGTLSLHGVTKPVTGNAKLKRVKDRVEASFEFKLGLSDFGIVIPSFAGVTVAKDVEIVVQFTGPMS